LGLLKHDLILFLDLPLPDVISRYRGAGLGSRPLVKSETDLEALYAKRLPVYESAARARGTADELAAIVAEWLSYAREGGGGKGK
jgi:shikimate kinase